MTERKKQTSKYVQVYRRPGQIVFVDAGGVISTVPCLDTMPEEINMQYAQAITTAMVAYGKYVGAYT